MRIQYPALGGISQLEQFNTLESFHLREVDMMSFGRYALTTAYMGILVPLEFSPF